MKPCSRCHATQSWTLGDGRFKCRSCGARYTSRCVWSSVRLPDDVKQCLVEAFVQGVSVYQQREDEGACVRSRERFYRLMRAVGALDARITQSVVRIDNRHTPHSASRGCMRGWASTSDVTIIDIVEENGQVRIRRPTYATAVDVLPLLRERSAIGGVYLHRNQAFANLQVQGDHVVVRRSSRSPLGTSLIETFWEYTRERLQAYGRINYRLLHLYLGEMCFRFNHRDADLAVLMRNLLHTTSSSDAKSILRGTPHNDRRFDTRVTLSNGGAAELSSASR
jgi:transposase